MHALVATRSVHTTAAACDWIDTVGGQVDRVTVLSVLDGKHTTRDAAEASNVALVRLPDITVDEVTLSGDPATVIRDVATGDYDPPESDILLIGPVSGNPDDRSTPPGSTTQELIGSPPVPVLVVPQ